MQLDIETIARLFYPKKNTDGMWIVVSLVLLFADQFC